MKLATKILLLLSLSSFLVISISSIGSAKSRTQSVKHVKPKAHDSTAAVASTVSSWETNPAFSKRLAPEVKVDEFSISPPIDYVLEQKQKNNDITDRDEFDWTGPKRSDGTMPKFRVVIFKTLSGDPLFPTAELALQTGLEGLNDHGRHYIHTDMEQGQVHSLDFVRAYYKWDPKFPADIASDHGFQYLTLQGSTMVTLLCYDDARHYKSTLDLMEAAALTFHQ